MKFLFNHSSKQFLKTKKHFIFILKINLFKKTLKNCFENLLNIFLKLINSFNKSIQTGSQDPIHSGQIKNRSRTNYTVLDILIKIIWKQKEFLDLRQWTAAFHWSEIHLTSARSYVRDP